MPAAVTGEFNPAAMEVPRRKKDQQICQRRKTPKRRIPRHGKRSWNSDAS
jgi:hypothetical protein